MAESIKVAVRIRPFNAREKQRKATLIVDMKNNTTEIKNPENPKEEPRRFTFDYSYWSHDGFKERTDGYYEPDNSRYADQKKVFDDLGRGVLDNAWKGFNCSLFAYGQTGSGKSYSMVGYGNNKGIVPISCEQLFTAIEEKRNSGKAGLELKVTFSMMEIYSEQVRDLLNPASLKVKGGLKVRQHPTKGFYVESLKSVSVNSYPEIERKMAEGTKNRTIASTAMNATSSRAHTIVSINFTQKEPNDLGESMTKTAIINLVDLAGSERAESTGATGDRLKEGSAINQSLSTLGNCIKALADQSQGKKGILVPYRDSVLTKLLQNALGGNSKTVMIAAISPADINYEESLSTLRYADRAKSIKTNAVVNESPTDKLIRELKEENARLMAKLKGGEIGTSQEDMKQQMAINQEELDNLKKSWREEMEAQMALVMAEQKAAKQANDEKEKKIKVTPHLWNLNEDPSLSGVIMHFIEDGTTTMGNGKTDPKPQIVLGGLGIQPEHAVITNKKGKVTFKPCKEVKVLHNGNPILDSKELHHNDRLMFGSNTLFVFHHPQDVAAWEKNKKKQQPSPTYETAQKEIAENSGLSKLAGSGQTKEDLLLQEDLIQMWPMVNEANAMSEELDKRRKFEITLVSPQALGKKHGRTEVRVKMKNLQNGTEFLWDRNKFINRKYMMTEQYQNVINGDTTEVPQEQDPFWEDSSSEILIGTVHVFLQSLAYLIELEEHLTITDIKGHDKGHLFVEIVPTDKDGKPLAEDVYVDDPSELVGRELHFVVKINGARGLPAQTASSFCRFRFYINDKFDITNEVPDTINPDYSHQTQFSFNPVTQQLVDYFTNDHLAIEIWGRQKSSDQMNNLNTRELMLKDRSYLDPVTSKNDKKLREEELNELQYKMAVEASTFRRRMERTESKMKKIKELVEETKNKGGTVVQVEDLEKIMNSGSRLKAVANLIAQTKKAEKTSQDGRVTSQACVLQ